VYSVIEAAATTKATPTPVTRPFQDTVVFLGATSVVCSAGSAGTVLNVAVAIPAWHKGVTAASGAAARRQLTTSRRGANARFRMATGRPSGQNEQFVRSRR